MRREAKPVLGILAAHDQHHGKRKDGDSDTSPRSATFS
jgi:hypothetical protein